MAFGDRRSVRDFNLPSGTWKNGFSIGGNFWVIRNSLLQPYRLFVGAIRTSTELPVRLGSGDFTGAIAIGNNVWVLNNTSNTLRHYVHENGRIRSASRYFNATLEARDWTGAFSAGGRVWLLDNTNNYLRGYTYSNGVFTRDSSLDRDLGSGDWSGGFVAGNYVGVIDNTSNFIRGYYYSNRVLTRVSELDISLGSGDWGGGVGFVNNAWVLENVSSSSSVLRAYDVANPVVNRLSASKLNNVVGESVVLTFKGLGARSGRLRRSGSSTNLATGTSGTYTVSRATAGGAWYFYEEFSGANFTGTVVRSWVYVNWKPATSIFETRRASSDVNLGAGNWHGAFSIGNRVWFLDNNRHYLIGYTHSNGVLTRASSLDKSLDSADWREVFSLGNRVWVLDIRSGHLRGYTHSNGVLTRAENLDRFLSDAGSGTTTGVFAISGLTDRIWVVKVTGSNSFFRGYTHSNGVFTRNSGSDVQFTGTAIREGFSDIRSNVWAIERQGNNVTDRLIGLSYSGSLISANSDNNLSFPAGADYRSAIVIGNRVWLVEDRANVARAYDFLTGTTPTPTTTLSASNRSPQAGQSVTLTFGSTNAVSGRLRVKGTTQNLATGVSGTHSVSRATAGSVTYTFQAFSGANFTGTSHTSEVTVTWSAAPQLPTAGLTVDDANPTTGEEVNLSFSSTNAMSGRLRVSGSTQNLATGTSGSHKLSRATAGSVTYTYEAFAGANFTGVVRSASVTVTWTDPTPPVPTLTASDLTPTTGQSSTLTFGATNAVSGHLRVSGTTQNLATGTSGSHNVTRSTAGSVTYVYTAFTGANFTGVSRSVSVTVTWNVPAPTVRSTLTANTTTPSLGITWKGTDGTTDLTSAGEGDIGKYIGSNWVKRLISFARKEVKGDLILTSAILPTTNLSVGQIPNSLSGASIPSHLRQYYRIENRNRQINLDFNNIRNRTDLMGFIFEAVTGAGTSEDPEVVRDIQFIPFGGSSPLQAIFYVDPAIASDAGVTAIDVRTVSDIPTSPSDGQVIELLAGISSGLPANRFYGKDGTTAQTSLANFSVYKYQTSNTRWVEQQRYYHVRSEELAFENRFLLKFSERGHNAIYVGYRKRPDLPTRFIFRGNNQVLPANSRFKVYEWVSR